MAIETQLTAKTGIAIINTPNSNIDGSGSMGLVIESVGNGTVVKTLIIKALTDTRSGMIRLFIRPSTGTPNLIMEIPIVARTRSSRDRSFSRIIKVNISLSAGETLYASTEQSDSFNIVALSMDWEYPTVRSDKTQLASNNGSAKLSLANPYLDGTGDIVTLLKAGSNGCAIKNITIKALQNISPGMIRIYITDSDGNHHLFYELNTPYFTKSATGKCFSFTINTKTWLKIQKDFYISMSTELSEIYAIQINGFDWSYPS